MLCLLMLFTLFTCNVIFDMFELRSTLHYLFTACIRFFFLMPLWVLFEDFCIAFELSSTFLLHLFEELLCG